MYTFRPADAGPSAGERPPYLTGLVRRDFTGPGAPIPDADELAFRAEYLTDLARPYGFPPDEEVLAGGGGHHYEEMAEELIAALVPPTEPVDLVVLAFAVPDVRAGRTVASYRGRVCPGDPLAFAVCDQGTAAPYTGLRLVRELAASGGCRRSLLLVVEQPTLAYRPTVPVTLPARAAAVGLRFDTAGPARLVADRQHPGMAPPAVAERLAADLAELRDGVRELELVLGAGLAGTAVDGLPVDRVRAAPAGQPSTGAWWALGDELSEPGGGTAPAGRRLALADYEPALGCLCLAAFDLAAAASVGDS